MPALRRRYNVIIPLLLFAIFSSCTPARMFSTSDIFPPQKVESHKDIRKGDAITSIWLNNGQPIYIYSSKVNFSVNNDTILLFSKFYPEPLKAIPVADIDSYLLNRSWLFKKILFYSSMAILLIVFEFWLY